MKTVPANAQTLLDTNTGTEPYSIVKVEWGSGTIYYGDKDNDSLNVLGKILSVSALSNTKKADSSGNVSSCSIELDDSDGSLKTLLNTLEIEGTACTVYQYFDELVTLDDAVTLLTGKILEDISWDEGQRTFSFTIESIQDDGEVGYTIEEGFIDNLNPDVVGDNIPLCFGSPIYVPAVQLRKIPRGTLKNEITYGVQSFAIDDGDYFPQDEEIEIDIDHIRFTGSFSGDVFTPTSSNDNHYTNLTPAIRPAESTDSDTDYTTLLWVDEGIQLEGLYVIVSKYVAAAATTFIMINKCIKQEGTKCTFIQPWMPNYTVRDNVNAVVNTTEHKFKIEHSDTILYAAGRPRTDWAEEYIYFMDYAVTKDAYDGKISDVRVLRYTKTLESDWKLPSGTEVKLVSSYTNLFACNLVNSLQIYEVMAYREVDGIKKLVSVPSSYYTKSLSDVQGGKTLTTIEFDTELSYRTCEKWEPDQIYVTLKSSIGSNISDIIRWVIENNTDLSVDNTSFADVKTKVADYPANFALFTTKNAIAFCEEVAWQARCAILVSNNTVYLKYLSEVPTGDFTIDEDLVASKTLTLGHMGIDNLSTRLIGSWRPNYLPDTEDRKITYSNNEDEYGLNVSSADMYIYNDEDLAKLSLYFWGYRVSNSWRTASFDAFLQALPLNAFDTLTHDIAILSTNTIRGDINESSHNSDTNTISLTSVLASKAGDETDDQPIEDLYYWYGDPAYPVIESENPITVEDQITGREEVDYTIDCEDELSADETGTDSFGDEGGDGGGANNLSIVWTKTPGIVERGINFDLEAQIINNQNVLQKLNFNTFVASNLTDINDVDNLGGINFVGGIWNTNTANIVGGSGVDVGNTFNIAGGANIVGALSPQFTVTDERILELTITGPYNVTRESAFNVSITNGPALGVFDVDYNGTDPLDKLFDATGAEVTTVTLDGAGAWSTAGWYISGGSGEKFGRITFVDQAKVYKDSSTDVFTVDGNSTYNLSIVEYDSTVTRGVSFNLGVELVTQGGDHINGNGTVYLYLQESTTDGDDIDPDTMTMQNGWAHIATTIDGGSGSDTITIVAERANTNSDSVIVTVDEPYLVFTSVPDLVYRGEYFDLTVQAQDVNGNILTVNPTVDLSINTGDVSDAFTPLSVNLVDGIGEVPAGEIDGGSGDDLTTLLAECTGYSDGISDSFSVFDDVDSFGIVIATFNTPSIAVDSINGYGCKIDNYGISSRWSNIAADTGRSIDPQDESWGTSPVGYGSPAQKVYINGVLVHDNTDSPLGTNYSIEYQKWKCPLIYGLGTPALKAGDVLTYKFLIAEPSNPNWKTPTLMLYLYQLRSTLYPTSPSVLLGSTSILGSAGWQTASFTIQ